MAYSGFEPRTLIIPVTPVTTVLSLSNPNNVRFMVFFIRNPINNRKLFF
jgi:hypothetical protein